MIGRRFLLQGNLLHPLKLRIQRRNRFAFKAENPFFQGKNAEAGHCHALFMPQLFQQLFRPAGDSDIGIYNLDFLQVGVVQGEIKTTALRLTVEHNRIVRRHDGGFAHLGRMKFLAEESDLVHINLLFRAQHIYQTTDNHIFTN